MGGLPETGSLETVSSSGESGANLIGGLARQPATRRLRSLPLAQPPPAGTPTRIRGTVDKLDGQNLTVKSRDGQMLTIELAANVAVITLVKKSIADIKAGDYVASTGVKGTDGRIHAIGMILFLSWVARWLA